MKVWFGAVWCANHITMQIPSSLFESLQASLQQEAKRICRDAAKLLRVPEKELEQKVLKTMPKITLVKDQTPSNCLVLLQNTLPYRCRLPCLLGTGRCHKHQEMTVPEGGTLTRISDSERLWCDEETNIVYNEHAQEVGTCKNSRLTLFVLEP